MNEQDKQYLDAIKRYRIHHLSLEAKRAPEVFERLMDSEEASIWIHSGYYEVMVEVETGPKMMTLRHPDYPQAKLKSKWLWRMFWGKRKDYPSYVTAHRGLWLFWFLDTLGLVTPWRAFNNYLSFDKDWRGNQ